MRIWAPMYTQACPLTGKMKTARNEAIECPRSNLCNKQEYKTVVEDGPYGRY